MALGNPDICGVCGVDRSSDNNKVVQGWRGYKEATRYNVCRMYYLRTGKERPMDGTPRDKHQHWVDAGNPDECGNCGLARPANDTWWVGFEHSARCNPCYSWRQTHQSEERNMVALPSGARRRVRRQGKSPSDHHADWVADICGNGGPERPSDGSKAKRL